MITIHFVVVDHGKRLLLFRIWTTTRGLSRCLCRISQIKSPFLFLRNNKKNVHRLFCMLGFDFTFANKNIGVSVIFLNFLNCENKSNIPFHHVNKLLHHRGDCFWFSSCLILTRVNTWLLTHPTAPFSVANHCLPVQNGNPYLVNNSQKNKKNNKEDVLLY